MNTTARDVLELSVKSGDGAPGPFTVGDLAQWVDLWPDFGWNMPKIQKSDIIGIGLALQCAAVKARDIAKTEMLLWKREGRSWRIVEPNEHSFARMLARQPNDYHTWTEFWRMVILHLEFAQNSYILKDIRQDGTVVGLIPLMPTRVRQRVGSAGGIFYEITTANEFQRAILGTNYMIVPANRIIHLKGRLLDGMMGLSNDVLGNPVFKLLDAISNYQTGVFGNDGKQPMVFETKETFPNNDVGNTAFRRLKDQLTERVRKMNQGGDPILLEAGLTAKAIALNAKDSMTIEAFNQQVESVCRIMETPPHKIFHYANVKYENMSAADNLYANDCLVPTATNIEERLRLAVLTDEELDIYYPEFDRLAMVAGDPASMQKWVEIGMKNGALEVNEARERFFQVNPLKGGDVRHVPVNMSMVDRDGKVVVQGAAGQVGNDGETGEATPSGRALRLVQNNG